MRLVFNDSPRPTLKVRRGAIAQLGERFAGSEEVCGSIPHGSTKFLHCNVRVVDKGAYCTYSASRSSRGLGHRPFTAVTGVRIPYGMPIFD